MEKKSFTWLGMLIFVVLFVVVIVFHIILVGAVKKAAEDATFIHGFLMLASIFLLYLGVLLHQALSSDSVDIYHLAIQVIGIILFIAGVVIAAAFGKEPTGGNRISGLAHFVSSEIFMVFIFSQMIFALLYVTQHYEEEEWLDYFQYHPCFGLWILIYFLSNYLTGIIFQMEQALGTITKILDEMSKYHIIGSLVILAPFAVIALQQYKEDFEEEEDEDEY